MSRRAFTVAVVAATIAWSIGLAALVTPLTANAAASGDLVRGSLPAVYYVGEDGKRYVFPHEKTYATWYSDFSGVQVVTDAELAAMPIGGNVTYRPGVKMIKIQTDPKVYAVGMDGTLRWVNSEALATCLYGANWNTQIDDVSDAFFVNYTIGADITACGDYNSAVEMAGSPNINTDKGLTAHGSDNLSVTSSSMPLSGGTLPLGAMGVNVLKFDVHNGGSSAMNLDSITVGRTGAGVAADWAAVYVYRGNDRLTTGRAMNNSTSEVTIGGLNLSIASGATESLWVAADVAGAATASDVHMFQVKALTSGTVAATGLPVTGPVFTISGAPAGTIAIATNGTLANVKAGELGAKLGQFQLTAGVENQNVQKIAVSYNGTVTRDNLSNFVLKQNGVTLATAATINAKDQMVFLLPMPFYLENGNVRTFEVYGDVNGSARAGQTITLYLDQNADLLSIGQSYGYGVTVTNGYAGAAVTVDAGRLTITSNGPASKNIARRGQDVEILNFSMAAQSNLEIRLITFGLAFGGGAIAADFSDVKLIDTATGQVVAGPYNSAAAVAMNDTFTLSAGGSRTFKLTVDVESTPAANETITATLNAFGGTDIRNLDNSTNVTPATDIVPNVNIAGNAHSVQIPGLDVVIGSTPTAQTFIQGSQGVALYSIGLAATDASNITLNQLTLVGQIDDVTTSGTFGYGVDAGNSFNAVALTVSLWDGSTQVGTTKSADAAGVIVFDNLNLVIAAGQSKGLEVKANLASAIPALADDIRFVVRDLTTDNIVDGLTATDVDGNPVNGVYAGAASDPCLVGPSMAIAGSGTLTVALAPQDADSEAGIVIGGTSNTVLAKYKFTAQNEELKMTKVRFALVAPGNAAGVSSLSLWDGSTLVGGPVGVTGAGMADFSGVNFNIPKDSNKTLTVKANLNSVGTGGVATAANIRIQLVDDDAAGATGTFEVRGTGVGSSTLLGLDTNGADNTATYNAYDKYMHKSKPSVALVSLPTPLLTAGNVTASRFTVSADAAGEIAIKGLVFQAQNQSNGLITIAGAGTTSMRRTGGAYIAGVLTVEDNDGAGPNDDDGLCEDNETCLLIVQFATEEVISAGSQVTYDLVLNVANASTGTDSLSMMLLGDTVFANGVLTGGTPNEIVVGGSGANFVWSDKSLLTHSDTVSGPSSIDWMKGTYVKVVPTDTQTMSN